MKKLTAYALAATAALLLLGSAAIGQQPSPDVIVEGIVYRASTGKGIPSLRVELTPGNANSPKRVLVTDNDGNFRFQARDEKYRGKNTLEVYDGGKLLFRQDIYTNEARFKRVRISVR